jgi:hypothetical protein
MAANALALGALAVGRKALSGSEPASSLMIGMGAAALATNVACLIMVGETARGRAQ